MAMFLSLITVTSFQFSQEYLNNKGKELEVAYKKEKEV